MTNNISPLAYPSPPTNGTSATQRHLFSVQWLRLHPQRWIPTKMVHTRRGGAIPANLNLGRLEDAAYIGRESIQLRYYDWTSTWVGIEKLILSRALIMRISIKRWAHVDSVLVEQKAQREQGICDLERLSRVSRESSEQTCTRAHKLAHWLTVNYH